MTDKRRVRGAEGPAEASSPEEAATADERVDEPVASQDGADDARAQAAEYLADLQRLQAEFENYRKRTVKEQTRALERAAEGLVRKLLEVLDEFELALVAASAKPDFERFLRGVELVYAKLVESLRSEGLEAIEAEGRPFDPELHEALLSGDDEDPAGEPVVVDVLRRGYRMKGRVIRPAGVKVARRRRERTEEPGQG